MFENDEDAAYDDDSYAWKVIQQMRFAYLDGSASQLDFTKKGAFPYRVIVAEGTEAIELIVLIGDGSLNLARATEVKRVPARDFGLSDGDVYRADMLDFGKVKIGVQVGRFSGNTVSSQKLNNFQDRYLFPQVDGSRSVFENIFTEEFSNKTAYTSDDIALLSTIANCEAKYFTAPQKLELIKKIAAVPSFWNAVPESSEDVILDLLEIRPSENTENYEQEILDGLVADHELLEVLFNELDNIRLAGNEDNADRFAQMLLAFWQQTNYKNQENYTYLPFVNGWDHGPTPLTLSYDGDVLLPERKYDGDVSFAAAKVTMKGEFNPFANYLFDERDDAIKITVSYHPFQPVQFVSENNG
ncbi:MAG: hypothetical protein AAFQ94_18850 [Bacteroidota bacterium]